MRKWEERNWNLQVKMILLRSFTVKGSRGIGCQQLVEVGSRQIFLRWEQ